MSILLLLVCAVNGGDAALSQRPHGLDRYRDFLSLPLIEEGVQAGYVSSFDRAGGNNDGFNRTYSALSETKKGEHVLLELRQPGVIYSLWFTGAQEGGSPLDWGNLRIYLDGEKKPRVDIEANALFAGKDPRFPEPLVAGPTISTGGHACYVPIPFGKSIIVATTKKVGFYHIFYHTYTRGRPVTSWTGKEDLSLMKFIFSRPGEARLASDKTLKEKGTEEVSPGEAAELVQLRGNVGLICSLRLTPRGKVTKERLRRTFLRCFFDGRKEAFVDAPVGHFFGSGLGEATVRSALFGMRPGGPYYANFPMPFWSRASISLHNGTDEAASWDYEVTWVKLPEKLFRKGLFGYFHAQWNEENPTTTGKDYRLLFARGSGVFVGNVLTIETIRQDNKQWWEGDARLYVDGCRTPVLHGTGHEDEYLGGWSSTFLSRPFTLPFHGEPKTGKLVNVTGQLNGDCTLYRIFAGIPFNREILYGTEHGKRPDQNYHYSSVAFFYGVPEVRLFSTDVVIPTKRSRIHRLTASRAGKPYELESSFVGDFDDRVFKAEARVLKGREEFTVKIDPGAHLVVIRQLFDHSVANQRARISVDGLYTCEWYRPGVNTKKRWCEMDAMLPPGATAGKRSIRLKIVPSTEWTEASYTIYSVVAPGKGKKLPSMTGGETAADPGQ